MLRRFFFLLIAVSVSGAAVFVGRTWMHAQVAARGGAVAVAETSRSGVRVLVAKANIPAGSFLRAESVRWEEWPEDGVSESYIVEGKSKPDDVIGAVVKANFTVGEPIMAARLAHPGDRGFMSAVLTPGNRAVTVNVTPSTGLAGFVSPGDRVDLILSMVIQPQDKTGHVRHLSKTILTNLRVLGMDQRLSDDKRDLTVPKTATLEVTPKEAEIVAVVSELGLLSLSLRSLATVDDADAQDATTSTWDDEVVHVAPTEAPAAPQRKVAVVRGSENSAIAVPPTNATEINQP